MALIRVLAFPAFKNRNSNPYNYLLYTGIKDLDVDVIEFSFISCLSLRFDLIHVHWPEIYLNSNYLIKSILYSIMLLFSLSIAKLFGKKIIWTVHNIKPHHIKYKWLNKCFWMIYIKLVNGIISLSKSNEKILLEKIKTLQHLPRVCLYHGLYKGFYDDSVIREHARHRLSLADDSEIYLFIGQVKRYKNVDLLIELFNNSQSLKDKILIIAGKFENDNYFRELSNKSLANRNIIIHNKFIDENELQNYFRASDMCILPFFDIFNSGSVLLSVSFDTPVLVPDNPNFNEYASLLNKGLIHTYTGQLKSIDILNSTTDKDIEYTSFVNQGLLWNELQIQMAAFYNKVIND